MLRFAGWVPLGLALLASSSRAEPAKTEPPPPGALVVKGSDTVGGELGPALARRFEELHPGTKVVWEALGSKTAFVGLFDGSAVLGASSRQVNEAEYKEAQRLGVDLQEFTIGFDGLALVVHPSNPIPQLTVEQVTSLFLGRITNWKELGGPDLAVTLYTRPTYSGTRSWFEEKVLHKEPKGPERMAGAAITLEHNLQIVPRVGQEPGAVSYIGLGALSAGIRAVPLALAADKPAVAPTLENVRSGVYPLFRPLFLYSRGAPTGGAAELLRFVLSVEGQRLVAASGFLPGGSKAEDVAQVAAGAKAAAVPVQLVRLPFDSGQVQLAKAQVAALKQAVKRIEPAKVRLKISGHADPSGSASRYLRFALRRAQLVAAMLTKLGVPSASITVESAGAGEPVATNDTAAGRAQNRRVDVLVLP